MRTLILLAAVVQAVLGGGSHFSVRLPFLNPAGVTYVDGPAPAGLAAGPLQYAAEVGYAAPAVAAAPAAEVGYAAPAVAAAPAAEVGYAASYLAAAPAAVGYAAPAAAAAPAAVGYAAPAVAAAPAAFGYAAPAVAAAPAAVGYAAPAGIAYASAPVKTVAAVPTVHHVPGVADVPVTRVEAQPGVIQKLVDVAKPAVSTRKFQLRRPAIQKQFYDIEERVVVRPAGSALVELEEPVAKIQKGPAVINPVGPVAVGAFPVHPAPAVVAAPVALAPSPAPEPVFVSTTPAPAFGPAPEPGPVAFQDEESVVVDNAEFAARAALSSESHQLEAEQRALNIQQQELQARLLDLDSRRQHLSRAHTGARVTGPLAKAGPAVEVHANGAPVDLVPHARAGPDVVPSVRAVSPEANQANQQRLIQLLTARGGVAEVGFGHAGPSPLPVGDAGPVRARVLSATPAPPHAEPAGERVSTRRVVVSRPIETVQDIDVVEPVTKLERIAVNHPTVFKTVHHDVARVPTSVPVLGKTLTPAIAHAAVPVGYVH
ncbi:hypothetical protein B7P43_G08915 [Cryptotermes secundus]|uniref:DUF4794 domain-containing protein n=1 Tax=Cryptotermes secundus TaxID=105785 RepID=A0A2J7QTD8_9NEOP|nr:calphotin [Cryptotermes secundus]PNF31846.1 hypothetical protein B7P43_G08915 [Cryptotermes secundus]